MKPLATLLIAAVLAVPALGAFAAGEKPADKPAAAASAAAAPAKPDVAQGGTKFTSLCAACHGADGNASRPDVPTLAGQPRQFLVMSLFMFREGQRKNEQMTPFVAQLSNADLNDLAQYFAAQKPASPQRSRPQADQLAKARGVTERNNCGACHQPTFIGQQHIPRLAGQNKDYLLAQLKAFKASTRADLDGTMTSAAQGLALDELELLADYLSTFIAP